MLKSAKWIVMLILFQCISSRSIAQSKKSDSSGIKELSISLGYFRARPRVKEIIPNAGFYFGIGLLKDFQAVVTQFEIKYGFGVALFDAKYNQSQICLLVGKKLNVDPKFILVPAAGVSYYSQLLLSEIKKSKEWTKIHSLLLYLFCEE